jgi:hypothetical protein
MSRQNKALSLCPPRKCNISCNSYHKYAITEPVVEDSDPWEREAFRGCEYDEMDG